MYREQHPDAIDTRLIFRVMPLRARTEAEP